MAYIAFLYQGLDFVYDSELRDQIFLHLPLIAGIVFGTLYLIFRIHFLKTLLLPAERYVAGLFGYRSSESDEDSPSSVADALTDCPFFL